VDVGCIQLSTGASTKYALLASCGLVSGSTTAVTHDTTARLKISEGACLVTGMKVMINMCYPQVQWWGAIGEVKGFSSAQPAKSLGMESITFPCDDFQLALSQNRLQLCVHSQLISLSQNHNRPAPSMRSMAYNSVRSDAAMTYRL